MPKESITCLAMSNLRLDVSWRADRDGGWIQLATVNTESNLTMPGDEPGDAPQRFDGWHITVDREQINQLIRHLRRARQAVYGRDE